MLTDKLLITKYAICIQYCHLKRSALVLYRVIKFFLFINTSISLLILINSFTADFHIGQLSNF